MIFVRRFASYCSLIVSFGFTAASANAGVLIFRGSQGLQFAEAASITVNAKDKVLSLGPQASTTSPINKLPSIKIAGTMLKGSDNTVGIYSDSTFEYILPTGLAKNTPITPAEAWASARLGFKKSPSDKSPEEIAASSFVAFLPGGVEELSRLCSDDRALRYIATSEKAFATQMELMAAAVKVYSSDPALAPLQTHVERSMRARFEQFETGLGDAVALQEALKLVTLSQAVYPNQPEQEKLRREITGRKAWLDRKQAVLRAFAAAGDWDPFLLGDRQFERYERAFSDIGKLHSTALKASFETHRRTGEDLLKEREFEAAFREFRFAGQRQPSDKVVQQKALIAWTEYSREIALDSKRNRKQLGSGEREALNQDIQFAANYKNENKLALALKSVADAEVIDPDSLPMLLKKAEILGAQRDFSGALAALDRYDLHAIDEEREKASSLRNDLLYRRTSSVEDTKTQLQKAWAEGSYHKIRDLAVKGLRAKDDDAELLHDAGAASQIMRDSKQSRAYFTRYLEVSDTLDADASQRAEVRRLLAALRDSNRTGEGDVNWLSGSKLPRNVYYCPVSLAFQPHIDHIEGQNKTKIAYEWEGDRLASITPFFEKPEHATGEKKISFAYDDRFPQVAAAVEGDTRAAKPASSDPDELVKRSSVVVLNNPYIDPEAVRSLTGKNVTLGIAGNRFFQPFVWDKVHYFRFTYDPAGRVAQAREIAGPGGPPTDLLLQFEWDGQQLTAIRGYQGADDRHGSKIYERKIEYQDGRIVAEEIQGQGKGSRIRYNYNGGRLVSAICSPDASLDGHSRQVTFR